MRELQLKWEFDGPGWAGWRSCGELDPFFILVGEVGPNAWYYEICIDVEDGHATIEAPVTRYATANEAQYEAEQFFVNMVNKWPKLELR